MKCVEPQGGSEKTLTTTLLNSKPSYFRKVCHYSVLIFAQIDGNALRGEQDPEGSH